MDALKEITVSIYQYVSAYINKQGYSPSIREIAKATGISRTNTHQHIGELCDSGYLFQTKNRWQSIYLTSFNPIEDAKIRGQK